MTDVPKIVYDRLRVPARGAYGKVHPEADLLTAFAERTLSGPEREGVLAHLALCEDCREVVALALPAADPAGASTATDADRDRATVTRAEALAPHKAALSWPTLRWAALAAAIVVVASVLLVRPGKLNPPAPVSLSPQSANATAAPTNASPPTVATEVTQSSTTPATGGAQSKSETTVLKKSKAATTTSQGASGILLANNSARNGEDSGQLNRSSMPSAPPAAFSYDAPPTPTRTETAEVASGSTAVETQTSGANALIAQNDAPIVKAKPAPQDTEDSQQQKTSAPTAFAKAQGSNSRYAANMTPMAGRAFAPNVRWTIKAGALQRSQDNGQSWQDALRPEHPLLCYANRGEDLWAGGQGGTLFHSADGGVTWAQVRPAIGSRALTSDITHIQVPASAVIVVSTGADEIWSSSDGGKSWTKN